ncbi:MAG: EAL domain-containing protein [Gammaproteobacteria bacterium]|nr:EAL domain-containing protein [Gammaproteobacteria bacterium]
MSNPSFILTQDRSNVPISIGFTVVLLLILALVLVSLSQSNNINVSLTTLVEKTNTKLQAANSMRDAIRMRADSLKKMRLMEDPFERDEEFLRFNQYAGIFRMARENLINIHMKPEEELIMQKMSSILKLAQPVNDAVAEHLFNDVETDLELIAQAEKLQNHLLVFLDALVVIENQTARTALSQANKYYINTRYTLFSIAVVVFILVIVIAVVVIRLVASKNRQVSYQAMHDPLTNLFNRCYFEHQVTEAIEQRKHFHHNYALLYLDLDQFKVVNDTCGHVAGDELLKQITSLLKNKVRKKDTLARLGGDEFGLLLKDCDIDRASSIGNELRNLINEFRFSWDNKIFSVGVSIGIAPITNETSDLKDVLIAADTACFAAKDAGRNLVHVYDKQDNILAEQEGQIQWMSELTAALQDDRFELYAQAINPVHGNSQNSTIKHYEVLVRFIDKKGKMYPPGAFLPAAERFGQITDIDCWVIENTFKFISAHRNQLSETVFSINISGRSLGDVEFKQNIHTLFKKYKIPAKSLGFEITETAAIASFENAIQFIQEFKKAGCLFSLDDFGSGLSSFAYLKQLPVDLLKIDGLFVHNIDVEPIDYAMVKSINEIAHLYNKKTVAEFVESEEILSKLLELGVDYAQGYGISKPMGLSEIAFA